MSSYDQLFASILLASGVSMSADHRSQLLALTKGVEMPITITSVVPIASNSSTVAPPAPKKIKPKAKAEPVVIAPISMSLPPPPTKEEALLIPVGLLPVSNSSASTEATTTSQYPNDTLRTNRYRIAVPNPKFCMARRWNGDAPIPGTEPAAEGSNGKMFPELQCTRLPTTGGLLCANCTKTETEYLADPENPSPLAKRTWRGRLDGPLFASAAFVGTELFFKKYPQGLPGDPTTAASPEWLAANTKSKAKPKAESKKTATTATTTTATATTAATSANATVTTAVTASATVTSASTTKTTVVSPAKEEWVLALIDDSSYVYERASFKCYEADMSITTSTKDMARMDRYQGRYEPSTNSINIYGTESDTE